MDLPVRVLGHTPPPPLPGVRQWWGNDEADNGLYLRHGMGLTPAAVMAELFTPAFVEVRGCVLLRHRFSERNFLTWWDKLDGDVIQIESVLNHTHLWDLMPEPPTMRTRTSWTGSENDSPRRGSTGCRGSSHRGGSSARWSTTMARPSPCTRRADANLRRSGQARKSGTADFGRPMIARSPRISTGRCASAGCSASTVAT